MNCIAIYLHELLQVTPLTLLLVPEDCCAQLVLKYLNGYGVVYHCTAHTHDVIICNKRVSHVHKDVSGHFNRNSGAHVQGGILLVAYW